MHIAHLNTFRHSDDFMLAQILKRLQLNNCLFRLLLYLLQLFLPRLRSWLQQQQPPTTSASHHSPLQLIRCKILSEGRILCHTLNTWLVTLDTSLSWQQKSNSKKNQTNKQKLQTAACTIFTDHKNESLYMQDVESKDMARSHTKNELHSYSFRRLPAITVPLSTKQQQPLPSTNKIQLSTTWYPPSSIFNFFSNFAARLASDVISVRFVCHITHADNINKKSEPMLMRRATATV